MSPAHIIHLIEHSQVVHRIEHSAPFQAIVGTLLTTLVGLAVAASFNCIRADRRIATALSSTVAPVAQRTFRIFR